MLRKLKKKSLSGVKWTAFATAAAALLQLAQLLILARFLTPLEYGIWGIVNIVIGFSSAFVDMGISNAIIHFQNIKKEELSSLYWLNVLAAIAVFLVVSCLAPVLAWLYKAPSLTPLIVLTAVSFMIIPFGQQSKLLLEKHLRFRIAAAIEVIAKMAGFTSMVLMLFAGFKIYAVVWSALLSTAIAAVLFFLVGGKECRPQFVLRLKGVEKFLKFGLFQMMEKTMNYFNLQADSLLIGGLLGLEVLGFYTLAKNLALRPMFLINPIVTRVTFPMMAKLQEDRELLRRAYLKTLSYLGAVNWPVYAFLAFSARPIVLIFFGLKWMDVVPYLEILSLWGGLRSMINPVGSLLLAKGRADLGFYWNAALFILVPAVTYLSSFWGLTGICYGQLFLSSLLQVPVWYFLVYKLCGTGFKDYFFAMGKPFLLSLLAGLGMLPFARLIPQHDTAVYLSAAFISYCLFYGLLSRRYNQAFLMVLGQLLGKRE